MLKRGQGRILNLASTSAFQPIPYLSTYAASKAFVLSFLEALNIERKGKGVTVTALCPGFTETKMIAKEDGKSMNLPLVNGIANRALAEFGRFQPRWLQRLMLDQVAKRGIK